MNSVKFTVFADFHYHKQSWPSRVCDLNVILQRANDAHVDFVIHAGDFCPQIVQSPEIVDAYLNNKHGLDVYGIYGNHELECMNWIPDLDREHPMKYVTPFLSNRNDTIHWGTPDGKMAEWGEIGYYWFERNGFRFVCTDTAYSQNRETGLWEHNPTLFVPKGNYPHEALGVPQLTWLERVLTDAAEKDIPCIVFSHIPFWWGSTCSDHENARNLFERINKIRQGTVMAAISGHMHTDYGSEKINDILYIDINSAINGHWQGEKVPHYDPCHTYEYTEYDDEGKPTGSYMKKYSDLFQGERGWFYKDPLSANITVYEDGVIDIEGTTSEWVYGIEPPVEVRHRGMHPWISSGTYKVKR